MFDHIGLKVHDLKASIRFYEKALAPLGFQLCSSDETSAGFGPKGDPSLWLYRSDKKGIGTHVALTAPDSKSVDKFHAAGLSAGGRDNGAPGLRSDYSPTYYGAFLIDPDGNNLEAISSR